MNAEADRDHLPGMICLAVHIPSNAGHRCVYWTDGVMRSVKCNTPADAYSHRRLINNDALLLTEPLDHPLVWLAEVRHKPGYPWRPAWYVPLATARKAGATDGDIGDSIRLSIGGETWVRCENHYTRRKLAKVRHKRVRVEGVRLL